MTITAEEDFRDFVVARWGELEPVARLVTLDAAAARRVTTDALADLHGQWGALLDEGVPGATARRCVLKAALAATRHHNPTPMGRDAHRAPTDLDPTVEADDAVLAALVVVVRSAGPLERAALAADTVWGVDPRRLADLLGMPSATVVDADRAVRGRLLEAHTAARAAAGWEPAEWAVDRDLDDALDLLLTDHTDPPDAVALVGERHRQVRRRSVVIGTGAALAAAAAGAWLVEGVATGTASRAVPTPPGPGDPVWVAANTWPARGGLAQDAGVAALVAGASPRAHLLWADDVAGQRVVVAASADASGTGGTLVRMWAGAVGADPGSLAPVGLVRDRVTFRDDVVPIAIEARTRSGRGPGAVLLLARPTVLEASFSPVVDYGRNGLVGRSWTEVLLDDGVATVPLGGALPPAFRVHLDGYDAGPLGATPLGLPTPSPSGPLAESLLDALGPFVAACTGLAASVVRSRITLEAAVPGDVLVQAARGQVPGPGRVVVAHTDLPSGALLRSVRVAGDGRGEAGPLDVETTKVLDDADPATPFATRLPAFRADVSRFLVVAPAAARAQLVAASSNTYPASKVTALHGGTGVLDVADFRRAAVYSLITWDRRGRRLPAIDALFRRRDPRDLWPRVR
ncbi:MAG: hypothetical protein ACJ714_09180 [Ornithinibacter sp.]